MADQEFLAAVHGLSSKMDNLNQNLKSNQIKQFDGNPKEFRRWIKSIEKFALLERVPEEKNKLIAFKSSSGAVSDFIHRYLTGDPNVTWDVLKGELSVRFADITDAQHAFMLLRHMKQEKSENVQIYAERLLSLAEQAYEGQEAGRVTEGKLVGFFVDGLYSDRLKLKVMRDNPRTMQEAINSARAEHNLQQRFQLRTGRTYFVPPSNTGEPMEIDHYRQRRDKRRENFDRPKIRQYDKDKVAPKKVFVIDQTAQKREIVCWTCNRKGHISRDCPTRKVEAIDATVGVEDEQWEELN
ncbi:uncharacterized protein LOC134249630 [Saccostrea cucullata]|uniref:uncharacterized protein LOC134249630 n=1 Tax=Saccostrea cuccullata TaxID=36930 RepID=UPI002ED5EBFF